MRNNFPFGHKSWYFGLDYLNVILNNHNRFCGFMLHFMFDKRAAPASTDAAGCEGAARRSADKDSISGAR